MSTAVAPVPLPAEAPVDPNAPVSFSNASLYVGDLNPDVVESNLFEAFSAVGSVASIRICRDNITRRSLGYGYVNFHNPDDAARAIDILNYERIKGRPCRIMWSQRDPTLRKTGVGNVFVKNLDASIDMQTLNDTFSKFGNILSCKVSTTKEGVSKGYGFVHFDSDESAHAAIRGANGLGLVGKVITVEKYIRRNDRKITSDWTNVYVKNFPLDWTDAKISELFSAYGPINSLVIRKDVEGNNLGFGFVNYETHEAAEAAVNALHEMKVGVEMVKTNVEGPDGVATGETTEIPRDKLLFVQKHQKKAERESIKLEQAKIEQAKKIEKYAGRNLYVRNFDDNIDEARLMNEFKEFGTISSCVVMRSSNGVSRGYGFVCFSSPEEATRAVTQVNGKMMDRKPIYVALAQRKDQRKMQLEAQRRQASMRNPGGAGGMGGMGIGGPMYGNMQLGGGYPGSMMPRGSGPMPSQQFMGQQYMGPMPGGMKPMYNAPGGVMNQYNNRAATGARGGRGGAGGRGGRGGSRGGMIGGGGRFDGGAPRMGPISQPGLPQPPAAIVPPSRNQPLTAQVLANATEEQRTNMIGERLYPLVALQQPDNASKITGMLLEMEISDLLNLLESPAALNEKIQEALAVLVQHQSRA